MQYKLANEQLDRALKSGNYTAINSAQKVVNDLLNATTVGSNPAKIAEYVQLDNERKAIAEGISTETKNLTANDLAIQTKEGEKHGADRELNRLDIAKKSVSSGFGEEIENLIGETAREQVVAKAVDLIKEYPEYKSKLEEEVRKGVDKRIQDVLERRYLKQERRGLLLQKKFVLNKEQADKDLNTMLRHFDNAAKAYSSPSLQQKRWVNSILDISGMSVAERRVLLADEGFVKGQFANIVKKMYATHTNANPGFLDRNNAIKNFADYRLDSRMKNFFDTHPSGKEVSVDTINGSPEVKAKVEQIINGPVTVDSIKKLENEKKGGIFLAILVALGAGAVSMDDIFPSSENMAAAA
jgi:hypothetical protein